MAIGKGRCRPTATTVGEQQNILHIASNSSATTREIGLQIETNWSPMNIWNIYLIFHKASDIECLKLKTNPSFKSTQSQIPTFKAHKAIRKKLVCEHDLWGRRAWGRKLPSVLQNRFTLGVTDAFQYYFHSV